MHRLLRPGDPLTPLASDLPEASTLDAGTWVKIRQKLRQYREVFKQLGEPQRMAEADDICLDHRKKLQARIHLLERMLHEPEGGKRISLANLKKKMYKDIADITSAQIEDAVAYVHHLLGLKPEQPCIIPHPALTQNGVKAGVQKPPALRYNKENDPLEPTIDRGDRRLRRGGQGRA